MGKFKQNIPSNAALPLNSDQDPNHHHETASQNKTRLKDSLTVIANVNTYHDLVWLHHYYAQRLGEKTRAQKSKRCESSQAARS